MSMVQQHPDGLIYVRTDSGTYSDMPENFALDYGAAFPALPAGAVERIYTPGDRHVVSYLPGGDVAQPMPWDFGDGAIADIAKLLAAQTARLTPGAPTPVQQYVAAMVAGLQITSAANSALNGTYAVDSVTQGKIEGVAASIANGKGLPGGGATFNYLDSANNVHVFGSADFLNFAQAVENYVYALIQTLVALEGGHEQTWPAAQATIP